MFLLANIGARTGIVFLPFDQHDVIAQFGGASLGSSACSGQQALKA